MNTHSKQSSPGTQGLGPSPAADPTLCAFGPRTLESSAAAARDGARRQPPKAAPAAAATIVIRNAARAVNHLVP
jgi:hypothetical protein